MESLKNTVEEALPKITVAKGQLAWHDWQRSLRIRQPFEQKMSAEWGPSAIVAGTDAWHPSAFKGTGVEHLLAPVEGPPAPVFSLIDWCGNVVGQIADCPFQVGRIYNVLNLGLGFAYYELIGCGAEMESSGQWCWWLEFKYTESCKQIYGMAYAEYRAANSNQVIK